MVSCQSVGPGNGRSQLGVQDPARTALVARAGGRECLGVLVPAHTGQWAQGRSLVAYGRDCPLGRLLLGLLLTGMEQGTLNRLRWICRFWEHIGAPTGVLGCPPYAGHFAKEQGRH
eukprot:12891107-Prorocentrum_lima.AAC.1